MKKIIAVLAVIIGTINHLQAQRTGEYKPKPSDIAIVNDTSEMKVLVSTPRRFYMGNGYDFLMLSSAVYDNGLSSKIATPRFTGVVNFGLNFHFDLNRKVGFFSGIGLKNLGFIEKFTEPTGDITTIKRRVYSVGVPLGIKIGDLRNRNFVFAGGGIDLPFNYRVKRFSEGKRFSKNYKNSEWFSNEVATIMPYVFLGLSVNPGFIIKAQYYPGNFFNEDYNYATPSGTLIYPYKGVRANIFSLSLSIDIHYNQYKIQEREYQKWKAELNSRKK